MPAAKSPAKTFKTMLERTGDRLNWTMSAFPLMFINSGKRRAASREGRVPGFQLPAQLRRVVVYDRQQSIRQNEAEHGTNGVNSFGCN